MVSRYFYFLIRKQKLIDGVRATGVYVYFIFGSVNML